MRTKMYIGVCDELAAELNKRVVAATRDFFTELVDQDQLNTVEYTRNNWVMERILLEDYFMDMLIGNLPEDPEYHQDLQELKNVIEKYYDLSGLIDRGNVCYFSIDDKGRYLVKELM